MRDDTTVLLAGIMHNLNNYIQTIIGNAALGMNSSTGCDTKNHFKVILATADRCGETIKQIMAIMLSGKRDAVPVDARAVVSEVIDIFEPVAENIIRISYSCEDVPGVYGNESDISQILLNLLFNARDSINDNGEIAIGVYHANLDFIINKGRDNSMDYVCISVRDNGPGIPENIRENLFTEVRSTKKEKAHSGIGLVVSQLLAERYGGWIECAHTDHTGTEFVVYLQVCYDGIVNKELEVSA